MAPVSWSWDHAASNLHWDEPRAAGYTASASSRLLPDPHRGAAAFGFTIDVTHTHGYRFRLSRPHAEKALQARARMRWCSRPAPSSAHLDIIERRQRLTVGPQLQPGDLSRSFDARIVVAKVGGDLIAGSASNS